MAEAGETLMQYPSRIIIASNIPTASAGAAGATAAAQDQGEPSQGETMKRQYEVNQWTSSNLMDTLFVFQLIFIGLSIAAIMTSLYRIGVVNGGVYAIIVAIILLAIIFITVRRAQYTKYTRDQRFWNRRQFDRAPAPPLKVTIPTCSGVSNIISDSIAAASESEKSASESLRKMFGR